MKNSKRLLAIVLSLVMMLCSVPMMVSADSADVAPAMANVHKNAVWSQEGFYWTNLSATGNTAIANGETQYSDFSATEKAIDTTEAEYLEFDVWSDVAVNNELDLWLSVAIWEDSGRALFYMPTLNAGWNHVVIDLSKVYNYANFTDVVYDRSIIRSMNVRGTPATEESVALNLKFANAAFTTDGEPTPKMNNTNEWAYDSVVGTFWTRDGIAGDYHIPPTGSDNGEHWYGHLGKTYDTTNAKFAELDIYSSVAMNTQVWVSSAAWADTGRARMEKGFDLVKGWNHVVVDLNGLNITSGTLNRAAVKNIFLEASTPADASDVALKMANLAFTTDVPFTPEVANKYFDVQEVKVTNSQFNSGEMTVPAGAGLYPNYQWWTQTEAIELPANAFIEMDLYASADTNSFGMWIGADSSANRPKYTIPALKKGWNHIVIDVDAPGHVNGSWSANDATLTGTFFEGSLSADTDVTIIRKNMWVTTSDLVIPERNPVNQLVEVVGVSNQMATTLTVPAGASLYPSYQMWKSFSPAVELAEVEFLEMDIFVSNDTNSFVIWSGTDGASVRGKWRVPELKAGWNHVVIDKINDFAGGNGGYDPATGTWSGMFIEGKLSDSKDVTINFSNICVTKTKSGDEPEEPEEPTDDPAVAPEAKYEYNVVATNASDLAGSKTNNADERYMNWDEYSAGFKPMMDNPLNIAAGDYIEFDFYSDVKTSGALSLGSLQDDPTKPNVGFQFYDNRSNRKSFEVQPGWNHIVLSTEGNFRSPDPTTLGSYKPQAVTGFILHGFGACGYIRLTNIAVTRDTPLPSASYKNPIIDYADALNFEKYWAAGVTDTYHNTAERAFINLGKTIDASKAEFLEFDVWVDAPINNMTFWACNNFDMPGRYSYTADFSGLKIGEWNHIVLDITKQTNQAGAWDKTQWRHVFLEGGPTADMETGVNFKIANIGCSKSYPDMNTTHTLVGTAVDGVHKGATVPAGAGLYPTYQMWGGFSAIDVSKADFIELDVYVSDSTSSFRMWSATDGAAVRGFWMIPELEAGWNHVVIDKTAVAGGNNGFSVDTFTEWNGFFFEGSLSEDKDIEIKIANVAATKFAPDASYKFIEVTSHPEIYVDVTGTEEGFAGEGTFAAPVDFSKGDTIELDVYAPADASEVTVTLKDVNGATATIAIADLAEGWNHVILNVADIVAGEGFAIKNVASIAFAGADAARFVFANLAITAEEAVKFDMEYVGKVYNTFDGYTEANIPAGDDIAESVDPIVLPWTVDVSEMGYVEFNLYVSAKCDLTLNLNATPIEEGDIYGQADAYYVLEGLTYGWNQIHVSLADLTANEWFDPTAVNYIYFSGVPAATYDVAFTVEDLALTTEAIDFDIAEGDYNVDGAVDMVDLIHVVNTTLAAEDVAFANVAEVAGAADYVIDALDIAGLRKLLFAAF